MADEFPSTAAALERSVDREAFSWLSSTAIWAVMSVFDVRIVPVELRDLILAGELGVERVNVLVVNLTEIGHRGSLLTAFCNL